MKFAAEFRDRELVATIADKIAGACKHDWTLMEFCGTHTVAIFRHGLKALLPDRLMGRGMTLLNLSIMVGVALAQIATGMIVGAFVPDGAAAPEAAYRAVFAFVALTMAAGLVFYLPLADVRPGDERAAADA